jgi:hypothetical protein
MKTAHEHIGKLPNTFVRCTTTPMTMWGNVGSVSMFTWWASSRLKTASHNGDTLRSESWEEEAEAR